MTESELNKFYIGDVIKLKATFQSNKIFVLFKYLVFKSYYLKSITMLEEIRLLGWNESIESKVD